MTIYSLTFKYVMLLSKNLILLIVFQLERHSNIMFFSILGNIWQRKDDEKKNQTETVWREERLNNIISNIAIRRTLFSNQVYYIRQLMTYRDKFSGIFRPTCNLYCSSCCCSRRNTNLQKDCRIKKRWLVALGNPHQS